MALLTFIRKDQLHLPKGKIVKAEAFSSLLEAKAILEKAKEESLAFKKSITIECEKLKEQAELAGFEEGLKKWNAQLALLEGQIKKVREDMEKAIVSLSLTAAKKIVGREIALSADTVVDIVASALKPVSQHRKITIYVNPHDLELIEKERKRIKDLFEHLESLTIIARDDVTPAGCVIETEAGIINAKLEKQWEALEEAFKTLLKERNHL